MKNTLIAQLEEMGFENVDNLWTRNPFTYTFSNSEILALYYSEPTGKCHFRRTDGLEHQEILNIAKDMIKEFGGKL